MFDPAKRLVLNPDIEKVGNDSVKYARYSVYDLELIRACAVDQNMKPLHILKIFPHRGWERRTLQRLVIKIKYGEEIIPGRRPGGGRPVRDHTLSANASALLNPDGDTISLGAAPLARQLGCTRKQARCVVKI